MSKLLAPITWQWYISAFYSRTKKHIHESDKSDYKPTHQKSESDQLSKSATSPKFQSSPRSTKNSLNASQKNPDPSHWRVWPKDSLKEGPAHPPPALEVPGCAHRTPWSSSCHQCRPDLGSGRDLGIGLGQVGINTYIYVFCILYIYILTWTIYILYYMLFSRI